MASQKRIRSCVAASTAAILGFLFWGGGRWSSGYASGGTFGPSQVNGVAKELRLATFNIHSGIGSDDRFNPNRTAALLGSFDLIGLQEVDGNRPWRSNLANALGKLLNMSSLFCPTELHWWCSIFGNAVLTKVPVTAWERTPLPSGWHMAHRSIVHLTLPFGRKTLNVLIVHLGKKSDRARHFRIATDTFKAMPAPAVMMGDFNTRPEDVLMQKLLASGEIQDPIGKKATGDRVDFILTRGVHVLDAGLIRNDASDHPVAWIDAEVPQ